MSNNNKKDSFIKEFKDELMNNSIVLSFALCIIIIGIFSLFFKADNTLLIGIALSTFILTLIQCFKNGNSLFNIFPIITLLIFGFFHDSINNIPVLNVLLEENVKNLIIYISFGTSLFLHVYNNIRKKYEIRKIINENNSEKNKLFSNNYKIIGTIGNKIDEIKKIINKKNIKDYELLNIIEDLEKYVEEEVFVSNIKSNLIVKSVDEEIPSFNINEVEETIIQTYNTKKARKIIASKDSDIMNEE